MFFEINDFIERCMAAGDPTKDYADSIYLAYTDFGNCDRTPEEIVREDAEISGYKFLGESHN